MVLERPKSYFHRLAEEDPEGERSRPARALSGTLCSSAVSAASTSAVAALVTVSSLPASSVKLTFTLMALPWSAATKV